MQRWSKETRIIIACAVLLAALDIYVRFATAPKAVSSSIVSTQELRLTDKQGNVRAVMSTDRDGEPGLMMYDKNGTVRLQLDAFETTPSLILMDENGERRAYYGMSSPTGDGELTFSTADGSTAASLMIHDNASSFSLMDGNGNSRASWNIVNDRVSSTFRSR
ncbi:MAG: hypothetical protein H7145_14960 [Akkermansiaceae bacterium]|nr:hypothetical protein [Armatimonadota bacterium]